MQFDLNLFSLICIYSMCVCVAASHLVLNQIRRMFYFHSRYIASDRLTWLSSSMHGVFKRRHIDLIFFLNFSNLIAPFSMPIIVFSRARLVILENLFFTTTIYQCVCFFFSILCRSIWPKQQPKNCVEISNFLINQIGVFLTVYTSCLFVFFLSLFFAVVESCYFSFD